MASVAENKSMELEGNLRTFQLPDILKFLAMGKMTGLLSLANELRHVDLLIKEGFLVGTASGDRALKLGQLLVYSGQVNRKDLEDALEFQHNDSESRMLGEVLIERKMVTREQIEEVLTLQLKEEIWDLCSWVDGTFKFEHGLPQAADRTLVAIEIGPMLEEGYQRVEEWHAVASKLDDARAVFRVRSDLESPPESKLNPNVWRVLSLVNGSNTVGTLIYLSGLGKFETLCSLDQLITLSIIETAAAQPVQPQEAKPENPDRAESPAPIASSNVEPRDEPKPLRRRWFGLGGKIEEAQSAAASSDPGRSQSTASRGDYLTGLAWACEILNEVLDRLCQNPSFPSDGDRATLAAILWSDVGMRMPRADLIQVDQGRYNAREFERFVEEAGEVDQHLLGCYEDGMAALAAIGQCLILQAREQLGEAEADGLISQIARDFLQQVNVRQPTEFIPRAWTQQWMGTLT
jgi:hypothetical protein